MSQPASTVIDARAAIDRGAQLDTGVTVGPFAVIGKHVRIGKGTTIGPHAVIEGRTTIGSENRIFQFASIGAIPQDLKYNGEESELVIGDRNRIRECVTIHLGTEMGGMVTRIGDDNLFMAYSHIAHDCNIGNHVIMANAATLGGHVTLEDGAIMGGLSGVHQFCKVGRRAFIAAGAIVVMDVSPFTTVQGDRARVSGLNLEGLKRSSISPDAISSLKKVFRIIFRSGMVMEESLKKARQEGGKSYEVGYFLDFIAGSSRGITR